MQNKEEKTNVMRLLDIKKVSYESFYYPADGSLTGEQVAEIIGASAERCFKTLVTEGKSGNHYVFDVPVDCELDLKKAAKSVGEKFVSMIKAKDLLPLTGYVHGGCSPIGMKKFFKTVFDASAENYDKIYFSGGRLGRFLCVATKDLSKVINFSFADVSAKTEG